MLTSQSWKFPVLLQMPSNLPLKGIHSTYKSKGKKAKIKKLSLCKTAAGIHEDNLRLHANGNNVKARAGLNTLTALTKKCQHFEDLPFALQCKTYKQYKEAARDQKKGF